MYSIVRQTLLKALITGILGLFPGLWPHTVFAQSEVSLLLGLPAKLEQQVRAQIGTTFSTDLYKLSIYSLAEFQEDPAMSVQAEGVVLAAGHESCEFASRNLQQHHVLCVLVSADAFTRIKLNRPDPDFDKRFGAIVIDQPLERQVKIASAVFPSLKKFGVLASAEESSLSSEDSNHADYHQQRGDQSQTQDASAALSGVTIDEFHNNRAVAPQVVHALSGQDALVAIPDKNVYSSERLRTVLLTAYGYAKPVIGYSRSYVRAGALISTYTTPDQIFRQAAEILDRFVSGQNTTEVSVYSPRYFSIADNPSIAKSLGLVRSFHYHEGYDYTDEDFTL